MNIYVLCALFVIYFLCGFIGRLIDNKFAILLGLTLKMGALTIALVILIGSDALNISEILKLGSLSNLDFKDAAVLLVVILSVLDILDTALEWADVSKTHMGK